MQLFRLISCVALAFCPCVYAGSVDPLQLAEIRRRVSAGLRRTLDYTCLETIQRWTRKKETAPWRLQDTLRLEVTVVGGNEQYAWPGATRFDEFRPADFIAGGMLGSGDFTSHARGIFLNASVALTPLEEPSR